MFARLRALVREETLDLHFRLRIAYLLGAFIPRRAGGRSRSVLLRLAGVAVGRGTIFFGMPAILAGPRYEQMLRIGARCWFNVGCTFDVHCPVEIGDDVYFAQDVMLLTQTHHIGPSARRAGELRNLPIKIGNGAWIGARACILPGVSIGSGAVVGAGALVTRDVPPDAVVGGVPATIIRSLAD